MNEELNPKAQPNTEKTYNCSWLKYVSMCLQVVGILAAVTTIVIANSKMKLNTYIFFTSFVYLPCKILFAMILFILVLRVVYEKIIIYGKLDFDCLAISNRFSLKNIMMIAYLFVGFFAAPLAGYVSALLLLFTCGGLFAWW